VDTHFVLGASAKAGHFRAAAGVKGTRQGKLITRQQTAGIWWDGNVVLVSIVVGSDLTNWRQLLPIPNFGGVGGGGGGNPQHIKLSSGKPSQT
jgi:hypothetical protein